MASIFFFLLIDRLMFLWPEFSPLPHPHPTPLSSSFSYCLLCLPPLLSCLYISLGLFSAAIFTSCLSLALPFILSSLSLLFPFHSSPFTFIYHHFLLPLPTSAPQLSYPTLVPTTTSLNHICHPPPHLLFSTSLFILLLHSPIRTMIRPRMKFWNTKLALVSLSAPLWRHHLPLLLSPTSGRNASPPLPQQRYVFSSSSSKWYVCLGVWIIFPDRAGGIPEEGFSVLFFLYQSLSILWIHLSQCVCCLV